MANQITDINITSEPETYNQPTLTYRVSQNQISGKIDGIEALKQTIKHILNTERYSNPIYSDSYGVELEQFVGKEIYIIEAEIENLLKEALLQDNRITNVYVTSVTKDDLDSCRIEFVVESIYGTFVEETSVLL